MVIIKCIKKYIFHNTQKVPLSCNHCTAGPCKLSKVYAHLLRYLSTSAAALRPPAIALTTSEAPVAASPQTKTLSANAGCSGLRNPIAKSTISHLITSGLPFSTISGRPPSGFGFQSISCTRTPVSLPSLPRNSSELIFHRRVQPSS